ncbi:MAG TPA: hypothetical protein PKY14_06545 [Bacteroidales bacterium]|jgi:hypothetical protein|nr:hypothetical protein [Bacteroidales bacterium]HPX44429.1 hypothetical protein [Bacteroidales bacterium]HQB86964.1 hypothetical protein [Bacteroidales bacterium]
MKGRGFILAIALPVLMMFMPEVSAQTADSTGSVADPAGNAGKVHSFYAGGGYGSNMIYLGSTMSRDNPYSYASLSYGLKNKLFLTGSAVHLNAADPPVAFYIASLTYSHAFNDWFDISAGIYRYQVDPSLTDTLFESFTYGDLTLGFDWKILYTKISAGTLFSDESQGFYQVRNSRYFQTPEFFRAKANISFDPYVNLMFGTMTEVTATSNTSSYSVSSPFRKWKDKGNNRPPGSTGGTTYSYKDIFGLIEIDFGLPVDINTDFMTIGLEPSYVIPLADDSYYPVTKGFVFSASIIFRIF